MNRHLFTSLMAMMLLTSLSISCSNDDDLLIPDPVAEDPLVVEPVIEEPLDSTIKYLALGDSYTIGQGVQESQRWPIQLSQMLMEETDEIIQTEIIARTGWRTRDLLNAIVDIDIENYNLVSLLIGVNNQYNNQPFSNFQEEFNTLLRQSILIAGGKENVFVLSIPDYGVTPFGANDSERIAEDIDNYNAYIQQRCTEEDIPYIDVIEISRYLGDSPGSLAADNLHPSGSQYTEWAIKALPIVKALLN